MRNVKLSFSLFHERIAFYQLGEVFNRVSDFVRGIDQTLNLTSALAALRLANAATTPQTDALRRTLQAVLPAAMENHKESVINA